MLLSRGADYAIRAMLDVASLPVDRKTVTERIARRQKIPVAFLSKVIAQLTQAGLMRTYRGAAGGVSLAKPADEINLRQVIEALQGPIALNQCTDPYDGCPRADTCPAGRVFQEGQRNLDALLEEAILADMAIEATILGMESESR
jgi:Rrf2 family protein